MNKRWLLVPLLSAAALAGAADWRQFRGTDSTGVAPAGEKVPAEVGPDRNVAWKVELPGRGVSSPVVADGRVFLTASDGPRHDRLSVLAFDAATGRRLWQRSLWATGPTHSHPKSCMAAPTPVTDGERVVALFATGDLVALDRDGNVLWVRALNQESPGATDGRGLASSPLLIGETVVVHMETQNTSFAAGVDLRSGADRWRTDRPREMCWTSPLAVPGRKPGERLALLQGMTRLSAVEPLTGKEVWHVERESDPIASAVLAGNVLYVPGAKGLAALELPPGGAAPKLLWEKPQLVAGMASPLVVGPRLYGLRGPILLSVDIKTGEVVSRLRLTGPFSATPVSAGGLLYCVNEAGLIQVVRPGEKEDQRVYSGALGETILATPAVADDALYVRSDQHLWKFARK
jgi:outer membrane protein assembly factor BamB